MRPASEDGLPGLDDLQDIEPPSDGSPRKPDPGLRPEVPEAAAPASGPETGL